MVTQRTHYIEKMNFEKLAEVLVSGSGFDLTNGWSFKDLEQFQNHLSEYKIIVYDSLSLTVRAFQPRTAFKLFIRLRGSSVLPARQLQNQAFKYFALDTEGF